MIYELYGHGGVGIVIDILTDNKNRISSEIRIATNKRGGTIASPGAVVYNYDRKGVIQVKCADVCEEKLFHDAAEVGVEDLDSEDDLFVLVTDPASLYQVKKSLEDLSYKCESTSLEKIPKTLVECDEEIIQANNALIEWLEDLDDVDSVYHNMDL